jgi:hypothetical protein
MEFSKLISHYVSSESIKNIEIDRILDKMNKNKELTNREKNFIYSYNQLRDEDFKDYMYLSKNLAFDVLSKLLNNNKKVICDLHGRNGKFGLQIIDITNDYENENCIIVMAGNEKHKLHDRYLYNIIYNIKKDEYSIEEQDEYFEKIEVDGSKY